MFCFFLPIGAMKACDLMAIQDSEDVRAERENKVIVDGTDAYLMDSALIAIDEASFEEMLNYFNADNDDALRRMIINGDLFIGDKGVRVTVIDYKLGKSFIEVIETAQRGYVESEFIVKKFEE